MKPVSDRLSKTGSALMKLMSTEDESEKIREVVDDLTARFDSVKNTMRQRANRLDDALQHMSEVFLCVFTLPGEFNVLEDSSRTKKIMALA